MSTNEGDYREDGTERGQGRGTRDAIGPTWWDVRKLAGDLERMYTRRVTIVIVPGDVTEPWVRPVLQVRISLSAGGPWCPGTLYGAADFGGPRGYATVAAAAHGALCEVWDKAASVGQFMDV